MKKFTLLLFLSIGIIVNTLAQCGVPAPIVVNASITICNYDATPEISATINPTWGDVVFIQFT